MGKTKKGRRPNHDDSPSSDAEEEVAAAEQPTKQTKTKSKPKSKNDEDTILSEEDEIPPSKNEKKSKKNDKKVNEISKELKKVQVSEKKNKKKVISSDDDESSGSDSDSKDNRQSKTKSKPPPKRGGFALLQMEDSDESDKSSDDDDEEEESEEEVIKKPPPKKQTQKDVPKEQPAKKNKKGKKKKDDSDDDIDKVLADLELSAKTSAKNEKLSNKKADSEERMKDDSKLAQVEVVESNAIETEESSVAKTAAQKKKEKKMKQAAKKLESVTKESVDTEQSVDTKETIDSQETEKLTESQIEGTQEVNTEEKSNVEVSEADKKKKKKKGEKAPPVEDKNAKKGPAKKAIAAMQETLKKIKEEEERLQKEEEERIKLEEEREAQRLEMIRLEKEKKDRKKKKEKERKERLKAEGKFMTPKQKADKARALAMIESLREQGAGVNVEETQKKPRLGTRIRPNRIKKQISEEQTGTQQEETTKVDVQIVDAKVESNKTEVKEEEAIKDSWDAESSSSDHEEDEEKVEKPPPQVTPKKSEKPVQVESSDEESDSDDESGSSDDDASEEKTDMVKRETALNRMKKREEEFEANKSTATMRAAVVCVLGHVDTGKTKILDKLRRTNVQDGEAGGITQQIGATNVPIENIKEQTRHVKGVNQIEFKIPGLLIIDTPGHESFSNLRSRGSSLCDIAILVVDIMHGLEPQTIESLNLLKQRKTPFVVALNKIDRLYDWQSCQRKDVKDIIKSQHVNTQNEFETRTKEVILQFAEQGLNAALYYENPDIRTYVSLIPTSAVTGEGMGNLLAIIIQSCEGLLHKRLLFSQQLQATVLEVKAISGLGMTIDTILINGVLKEGDTIVLAGTDGPIVTQIRSLLMPQPMKELRVKNAYIEYKEVIAAQGVKITAKDLEKAVAGLNLLVAHKPDEIDILKEEVTKELKSALSSIKLSERGVYVQASTLGSLEALLEFLKASKIPYSAIRIGPVVKRDVMKASAMLEHEPQYAVILAFDVKIERDAQEMADSVGVTIFQADIIYHLFDKFMAHREALKQRKREEFKHIAVFPCKLKILPQFVFNSRDPIVIGVIVEAGIVKEGTPICVPSKEFVDIGVVTSIEMNHKNVETARKGMEVCIKIDPIPGESPKMYGRHFEETDFLISKISRQSIDACKDYFRDDLLKTDWQLMVELKNLFQIL